jgi:putative colanic acid biosynthesis acetyltransferase WcaF
MDVNLAEFDNSGFERGAGRAREAAWLTLRRLFFLNCPVRAYAFRRSLLRLFGADVGQGVIIKPDVKITFPWRLRVGSHTWLGEEAWILNFASVTIGSNVCISQRAFLCTGSHDWSDPKFSFVSRPIVVEDGAWICAGVFVAPGITIGGNTVVTAGSVVNRDLPQGMVCSGNPCVPVKPRTTRD